MAIRDHRVCVLPENQADAEGKNVRFLAIIKLKPWNGMSLTRPALNRRLRHPGHCYEGSEKAVVAVAEEFEEFHVAEFLELLTNLGLNVGVVRM